MQSKRKQTKKTKNKKEPTEKKEENEKAEPYKDRKQAGLEIVSEGEANLMLSFALFFLPSPSFLVVVALPLYLLLIFQRTSGAVSQRLASTILLPNDA